MSDKEVLSGYLGFLRSLPQDRRDLQVIGEANYYGPTYSCGGSSTTQGYPQQSHDPLVSPAVLEGTYLVLPETFWAPVNEAWKNVEGQLSGADMDAAAISFGTSGICSGTASQQAAFLEWFIPRIRSSTWLYVLGGLAAAAFAGGILYTLKRS